MHLKFQPNQPMCRPSRGDGMNEANPQALRPLVPAVSGRDGQRQASWLQSDYSDHVWFVSDTHDPERTATIDFRYRLPDGRNLTDAVGLYATVKEYAWFVRDTRYSRIDDAITQATLVRNLMHLAHALRLRKLSSFAHLQPYDLEQLVEDCRYGLDAVLKASERVDVYLRELRDADDINPQPFGGLPPYVIPSSGAETRTMHVDQVIAACHLPTSASMLPRVAVLMARAAKANGLKVEANKSSDEVPPLPNLTAQALQRWLAPLEQLYAIRRHMMADSIKFKPFPRGAARVAAVKGIGVERTPIPPPMLALHLFEHSARWILDGDTVLTLQSSKRCDIVRMATACWIVIAAFSARRAGEIDDLRAGCIRGDEDSGWWLHVYIEKTLQRKEWIPVPTLVAHAVEMLELISDAARKEAGSDRLFQWMRPDGNVVGLKVGRSLDNFASLVKVPPHEFSTEQAVEWHWHPHQFRRFFAVLYFYRFEDGTIEALSHHLRHFSLEMTKRYVTQDPEVAALWTDVEWGYTGHVARSIVAGERSISGAAGERLKKVAKRLTDNFRRKLQVATPERVGASLALIMQRQGMVLTPKPWVTCSCPRTRDAALTAACRRESKDEHEAFGPDFAQAGPSVCSACPHAIVEGARNSVVNDEVTHLEAVVASSDREGTLFGALEAARMVELSHVRDTKYDSTEPLCSTAQSERTE